MARRYSRREFLTDAGVALAGAVLLKLFTPNPESPVAIAPTNPSTSF